MALSEDGTYEVRAAAARNRLYIDLSGRLSAEEIQTTADMAVEAAEALDPPFDIVTDLSGFRPPDPEAAGPIKEAQAALAEMGIDRVVRVADEDTSAVVVNAFERRSRDVGYEGFTADSLAEAERLLD
jgi:hypothetical protein